jgi:hypothetical protein
VVGEDEALVGQDVEYSVTNSNKDGSAGVVNDGSDVKWAIKVGKNGGIDKEALKNMIGKKAIVLKMKPEWEKEGIITVMPYMNSPTETVSVKTKIENKWKLPVVIDRYKMPGLNEDGSDIADDMCFGFGTKLPRPIYTETTVGNYKKEYEESGFSGLKHKFISNEGIRIDSKSIYSIEECYSLRYIVEIPILKKIIPSISTGLDIRLFNNFSDEYLFWDFKETAKLCFAQGDMKNNISKMIDKMQENKGGIYESNELNTAVINDPKTLNYCKKINKYLADKLHIHKGNLNDLKDMQPYFDNDEELKRREKKGKENFTRPIYNSWTNRIGGLTIATNDIWSTEVAITGYKLEGKEYKVEYRITLWDHFGLDKPDMEKIHNLTPIAAETFICWFILQHLRGYKPFITKIQFERTFEGNIDKDKTQIKD